MLRTFAVVLTLTSGLAGTGPPTSTTSIDASTPRPYDESDAANPLAVYPRRPGAVHADIEAAFGTPILLNGEQLTLTSATVEPGPLPPPAPPPRPLGVAALAGVRAFDPVLEEPADSIVHLVVTSDGSPANLACTITAALDGASAARWATPSSPTTADFHFAIGPRRGRFYVACSGTAALLIAGFSGAMPPRAVWSFDV